MMKWMLMITAATLVTLGSPAFADCRAELADLTGGVSKDGSMAPLQTETGGTPQVDTAAASADGDQPETGEGEVIKDGSVAPLEASDTRAMSGQDAQAQQAGGETAAAQTGDGSTGSANGGMETSARQDAIDRAQAALEAGDEEACMAAVEEAKAL